MQNSNNEEIREKKALAERYIFEAEDFIFDGKIQAGMKLYQKATNIYFDIGSYIKIPDVFIRISTLLNKESSIYLAMDYLQKIRFRLKNRELVEEEAKIMMVMGNLSFKLNDYDSAAEYYEESANLYLKADPIDYRSPSSLFLIRAAECYEYSGKHEIAERIIIQAVIQLNPNATDYLIKEDKGLNHLNKGNFKDAIPIYLELFGFFKEGLEKNLSFVMEDSTVLKNIAIFAKSRLIHIISEYRLILMFCYNQIGDNKTSIQYARESIKELNLGIRLLKKVIIADHWSKQDLKRLTYIGFMRAYFQKFHHIKNKKPEDQIQHYIAKGFTGKILEELIKLPYYDLCIKTETYALEDIDDLLEKFNLGRLEKYKGYIVGKK